ncbi:MAG: hypothetical protein JXR36_02575, partial [Bacteroidales bacterium]|nr:hypothetical protein [Bacteroidales bacterium]
MKKILIISVLMLLLQPFANKTIAQTGPGGVGNATGSTGQPENVIWFDASTLSLSDLDAVATWTDLSGNTNDAMQASVNQQPVYRTGQINGLPAIVFDPSGGAGNQDFMPFNGNLIANSDYTVILVSKRRSNSSRKIMIGGSDASSNKNLHFYCNDASTLNSNHYGNDYNSSLLAAGTGGTDINTYGIFTTLLSSSESTDQRRHYQNNTLLGTRSNNAKLSSYNGAAIARYVPTNTYSDIDVAEVIIFSNALNDAQLQIVNQYLEVKYGITINNDLYSPVLAYKNNVAGIGEEANGEHSVAASSGMYMTALSGLNVGDYVFASHNGLANSSANFTNADVPAGVDLRYNRIWYAEEVNTPEVRIAFDFNEALTDGLYPVNFNNYVLLYRSGTSGAFTVVQNANGISDGDRVYFDLNSTDFQSGYYTFATEDDVNSPLKGSNGRTWYSLISGDWDDWQTWTLDPSGALPNNPDMLTPTTSPTSSADKVVVLSGKTVTVASDNKLNTSLTVDGRLDINSTTGHSFGVIRGFGRILLQGDNFPAGDATHFVSEGQGEGTVVYQGNSYDLATAREFFNVEIILNDATQKLTLTNNYQINGNLTIEIGNLQINDATDDRIINLTVNKDVSVLSDGSISVGTGNTFATANYQIGTGVMPEDDGLEYHSIFHQITVGGDFLNNGTVILSNLTAPTYDAFATNGAVTLIFTGTSNNKATLNGQTDLYNLIIDKGVNKNYILELFSSDIANFRLFGANNVGRITNLGYTAENPQVRKALFIKNGTLKLTGNIEIPTLSEGGVEGGNGDYAIGKNARLWVAGNNVVVYSTASDINQITGYTATAVGVNSGGGVQALSVYGEFKISNGFLGTRNSAGFIFWSQANAQVKIEGGTVNTSQLRSANGGGGVASYIQTGGLFIARGNQTEAGSVDGGYPIFGFDDGTGIFSMSGGEILLQDIGGGNTNGFFIPSFEGNYNVTGGKVTIEIASGNNFEIGSTAPVWDLEIKRLSGTGTALVRQTHNLKVLHNLTINGNCELDVQDDFDATDYDLFIGGNFDLKNGGSYLARTNTTHFYSSGSSTIYIRNTSNAGELKFNNLIIEKDQRWNPLLFNSVVVLSSGRAATLQPIEILGDFTITRGEFDYNRWDIHLKGNLEIIDGQIIETDTPDGKLVLNGTSSQTIKGAYGKEQAFGNFQLDNANGAKLLSDVNITDFILSQGLMDLDIYNMEVAGTLTTTGTYSPALMFQTAGNASDGGITLPVTQNDTYFFPIGTNANSITRYTPATAIVTNYSDDGTIKVSVADNFLQTAVTPGGNTYSYYWEVVADGFSAPPNVIYTFKLDDSDDEDNTGDGVIKNSWVAGEVLNESPYERNDVDGAVNSPSNLFFTTKTLLLRDASYTAGKNSSFTGNLKIYYSYNTSPGTRRDWNDANYWTSVPHGPGQTKIGSGYPQAGDIAVIGYHTDNTRHQVQLDNHNARCAKLIFEKSPTGSIPLFFINENVKDVNLGEVEGFGNIYIDIDGVDDCDFQQTDFTAWANNSSNYWQYTLENGNHTLPSYPSIFPTLRIAGQYYNGDGALGSFPRSAKFTNDITCYAMFVDSRALLYLNDGANGDITCQTEFRVGWNNPGKVVFPQNNSRTITAGSILVRSMDGSNRESDNEFVIDENATVEHHIFLSGDFNIQNNDVSVGTPTVDFYANTGGGGVILELNGSSSADFNNDFNSSSVPDLYRIVMNKEAASVWVAFNFMDAFTLNGPTDGDEKAIELISGRLGLHDAGIDVTLTSGGADFKIPQEAKLWLGSSATARVSGSNTGIWLDGQLDIGFGVNALFNEGTNNYIEYTASGVSEIFINSGSNKFYVGSQIRRSTNTEEGILNFRLTSETGDVRIGTDAGNIPENNRGVFEILNAGSNFTMTENSIIIIANAQNNPQFPATYIAPEIYSLGTGSIIQFGNTNTAANQTIGLFSNIPLKNIKTNNASTNNPTLKICYKDLFIDENLTIDANTILNSDNWDITIHGNWTNNGTYLPVRNTTYFSGSLTQEITGETDFYNFKKTATNLVNINSDINVLNEFHLLDGILADNGNDIFVYGNLFNDGTHDWGGSGNGISVVGAIQQEMNTSGLWGKITINNPDGLFVRTAIPTIDIDDAVQMQSGIFDIGKNMLVLDEDAIFIEASAYGENNMVQTNISFTDNGIKKSFADAYSGDFIFPIGSQGKYTPVEFNITLTDAGSIRIKAANEKHPTIQEDVEPCNEIVDTINVLQYHWVVEGLGFTNFSANATMKYYDEDVKVTAPYNITDYITAKLLLGTTSWNKFTHVDFDEANNLLRFHFINT